MKLIYSVLIVFALSAINSGNANAQMMSGFSDMNFYFKPQVGPNPAHNVIKVSWQQAMGGNTMMQLYNQSGILVATLVNQNYVAGNHSRTCNLAGILRGTYTFRLIVPGNSWSTTLVLQ